jgi:hypothetical protein
MKPYSLNNQELLGILNGWLEYFLATDRSTFTKKKRSNSSYGKPIDADVVCSEDYLKYMQKKPQGVPPHGVDGFPEDVWGVDFLNETPSQYQKRLIQLDKDLCDFFGARNNAVKMYYPKGGYMSWHHNANASGQNILISWSKDGKGFFRYQDPVTKQIVTMNDTPGWTVKAGYYGNWKEPDKIYWHCANAREEERMTLAYIIPHDGLWESMMESIEGDF